MSAIQIFVFVSSLIGLGLGQTAQVNVTFSPLNIPPTATCHAEVDFFDVNGNLIKIKTLALSPGQSAQVTLSRLELAGLLAPAHPLFWAQAGLDACTGDKNCNIKFCAQSMSASGQEADAFGSADLLLPNQLEFLSND
ncbi:MAG TPA: hypothetical protein VMA09_05090 [Candidatus Binataceae bacterium]|nr:hypothetical protein [Candidatus Binataceae bacterium]